MSILKEPYRSGAVATTYHDWDHDSIAEKKITIQSNENIFNLDRLLYALALLGVTAGLSFLWLPFLLLNLLTIAVWSIFPKTRITTQRQSTYLVQDGHDDYCRKRHIAPNINWRLYNGNQIYKDAVIEWLDAVRLTDDVKINRDDWGEYLSKTASMVVESSGKNISPDWEKYKILKELMK